MNRIVIGRVAFKIKMWKLIVLCFSYLCLVNCELAPFITKCKWDDTKCLKESMAKAIPIFAEGMPELNVEKMDPMVIKHVDATNSNLKLIVTDVTLTGLKNCEAKKLTRDLAKEKLFIKIICAANLEGQYDMNGQLFVLPITGKGGLHVKIRKILINAEIDLSTFDDDKGNTHWKVKSWKHDFELKEKSDVKFDNLFPDNQFLRQTTNELIASNGNDVIVEIGAPVIKAVIAKVVKNIENFFAVVPLSELVIDN